MPSSDQSFGGGKAGRDGFGSAALKRRPILLGLTALALTLGIDTANPVRLAAAATDSEGAADFLDGLGKRAVELLSDPSVPQNEREASFNELLRDYFNVPAIARFIMGRYWRRMDDRQKDDFTAVFKRVLAKRFVPWFAEASSYRLDIGRVARDKKNGKVLNVFSEVSLPGGEQVDATWRIQEADGGYRVLDIVANGVSMALTLRSEYGSLLSQSNGDVDNLIRLLEDRIGAAA